MLFLREYLIVSQEKILIEIHRKLADETRQTEIYDDTDAEIILNSIEYTLNDSEIHPLVNFQNSNDSFLQ